MYVFRITNFRFVPGFSTIQFHQLFIETGFMKFHHQLHLHQSVSLQTLWQFPTLKSRSELFPPAETLLRKLCQHRQSTLFTHCVHYSIKCTASRSPQRRFPHSYSECSSSMRNQSTFLICIFLIVHVVIYLCCPCLFCFRLWHRSAPELPPDLQHLRIHQQVQIGRLHGPAARQVVQSGSLWKPCVRRHRGQSQTVCVCVCES